MNSTFSAKDGLGGELVPPPDKSLTHRALLLSSIAEGRTLIHNPLDTGDCRSTQRCLEELGVIVKESLKSGQRLLEVSGTGLMGYREPAEVLDAGNSGTTIRLLAGLLAGLPIYAVISGDRSLAARPMGRIIEPLRQMGAGIAGRSDGKFAPLTFLPGEGLLAARSLSLEIPSAQVKSALLLAALKCSGTTVISGRIDSRDHTERLFQYLELPLVREKEYLKLEPCSVIPPFEITIPGDISSAAFFIAGALISGKDLLIRHCGINPTRLGFLKVIRKMGAEAHILEVGVNCGEPVGTIQIRPGELKGVVIREAEIPDLIDEIPLIAVIALFARGSTTIQGAGELRFKESDRLEAIARLVRAVGAELSLDQDGFTIEGGQPLSGGVIDSGHDHRIAMAGAILSAGVRDRIVVRGIEAAEVSFPDFIASFRALGGEVE